MTTPAKRATVYFDPIIHKALKLKSIKTSKSISKLVNEAVIEALAEDVEDLAVFEQRVNETLISYDKMVKRFGRHKKTIRFKELRGIGNVKMTTDEIMALTRGDQ